MAASTAAPDASSSETLSLFPDMAAATSGVASLRRVGASRSAPSAIGRRAAVAVAAAAAEAAVSSWAAGGPVIAGSLVMQCCAVLCGTTGRGGSTAGRRGTKQVLLGGHPGGGGARRWRAGVAGGGVSMTREAAQPGCPRLCPIAMHMTCPPASSAAEGARVAAVGKTMVVPSQLHRTGRPCPKVAPVQQWQRRCPSASAWQLRNQGAGSLEESPCMQGRDP